MTRHVTRRQFLQTGLGAAAAPFAFRSGSADEPRRLRVAAIYTVCYYRSHAHVILDNFIRPYLFNGRLIRPPVEVVSLYTDQISRRRPDLSADLARRLRLPLSRSIAEALTLGGRDLAVDAVLSIGEHGDYPMTRLRQRRYPRKRFFDEIVAVQRRAGRTVPVFNDKHLSYRWDWARAMYDTARDLRIPFMAGSSVPLAQRRPPLELPANAVIEEAVSIHGGPMEIYDFHALEVLQALVEARRGGETGIESIEHLSGAALFEAARRGRWSLPLAEAAMRCEFGDEVPDLSRRMNGLEPYGVLVRYRDGLRATMLKIGFSATRWNFACKLAGEARPRATGHYVGPWNNRCLFMALSHAIQHFFRTRESPYPVERTLLTTGALEAAMQSAARGEPLETPHLRITYAPRDFRAFRETGASWRVLPPETPEPPAFADLPLRRGATER